MALQLAKTTIAQAGMVVCKLIHQLFEAVVDPNVTTEFWISECSGRLETGKHIGGEWEMYWAVS
jgi:hypothetical protein